MSHSRRKCDYVTVTSAVFAKLVLKSPFVCSLTLQRFWLSAKFFHWHVGPFNWNTTTCQWSELDEPFSQKMRIRDSDIRRFRATRSEIGFCLLSNFATVLTICKILSLACRPFQWKYNEVSTIRIGLAILAENAIAWQRYPPFSRNSWRNQSLLSNYTIDYKFYYLTKILST